MATKEELLERAKELDIPGRSGMDKAELEEAVSKAEADKGGSDFAERAETGDEEGGAVERGDAVAVDEEAAESNVLSDEEAEAAAQERLDTVEEQAGEEHAELTQDELDFEGPLHLQAPEERVMTGAVNEEHAKEQEELLADLPEDHVGDVTEAGTVGGKEAKTGSGPNGEVTLQDVYDFPDPYRFDPPAQAQDEEGNGWSSAGEVYAQKSVFYTDGLSGGAEQNLERAYEVPEVLQSNNPEVRKAGDESLSEAAKEAMSDEDKQRAADAKSNDG